MARPLIEHLLYSVADTLQIPLHAVGKGYKSDTTTTEEVQIGPWKVPFHVRVKTDVVTPNAVGAWAYFGYNLWMYVTSYNNGNSVNIIVFDGTIAKLSKGLLTTPCENGDLKATVLRLKQAGGILYDFQDGKWVQAAFE